MEEKALEEMDKDLKPMVSSLKAMANELLHLRSKMHKALFKEAVMRAEKEEEEGAEYRLTAVPEQLRAITDGPFDQISFCDLAKRSTSETELELGTVISSYPPVSWPSLRGNRTGIAD